jgi:multiple antibiotic resistance protein
LVIAILALDLQGRLPAFAARRRKTEGIVKEDVSITPIAVPMLAGPGAISMVMILSARYSGAEGTLLFAVIVLVSLSVWVLLRQATRVVGFLGRTGINVIGRLLGILVLAIAVQFIVDGLLELAPLFGEALTGA